MSPEAGIDNNNKAKLSLKTTPEVRKAFDVLISKEGFLESSEVILKYVSSLLPLSDEDNEELPEDVIYIIKRLISSLSSQRMFIRQGSYTILQVMLQLYPQILPFTMSFIKQFCDNKSKSLRESWCDYEMGLTLAYGAIIRSGNAMEEVCCAPKIIKTLLNAMNGKFSTSLVAGQFLIDLLSMYNEENISLLVWKEAREIVQEEVESMSSSSLWLRIILARDENIKNFSDVDPDFQSKTFDHSTFASVASLFKKLFQNNVNLTPMLEDYFKSLLLYCENSDGEGNLASFFSDAVTPILNASLPRDNVFVFNITRVALSYLKSRKRVETILSPELMEMLLVSSTSKLEEVNASARGLLSAILQLIIRNKESGSKIQLAVAKRLVSTSAKLNFDAVTKTTVLQQMMEHLAADAVIGFAKIFYKQLDTFYGDEDPENSSMFSDVLTSCQWLSRLVCHPSLVEFEHCTWKADQVVQLFKVSFLKKFSAKNQQQLKDCYLRALNQSSSSIEWQALFVERITQKIKTLLENEDNKECLSEGDRDLFLSTSRRLQELGTDSLSKNDLAVFKILYGHLGLYIFIESKNCEELIEEINLCFKKARKSKKKSAKRESSGGSEKEKEVEPQWVEVIVDLLMSILSKGENVWRKLVTAIFKHICHSLSPESLYLLTDSINPEKGDVILETEEEMRSNDDSMEEEEDLENEDDEEIDEEGEEQDDEEEDDDDDDDDEESDESDDEDIEDDDEENIFDLKKKMQALVGVPMEDVDINQVPQEELDNLDQQLGALIGKYIALRKRKKVAKKLKLEKDETALMCFQTRVCDLLETLIREAPSLDHILALIKPILLAINKNLEDKLQKHLLDKLRSLVSEIVKVKKFAKSATISSDGLVEYLQNFFEFSKKLSNKMKNTVGSCCLFLVRSGLHLAAEEDEKDCDKVMEAYGTYLESALKETNTEIFDGPVHLESGSIRIVLRKLLDTVFKNNIKPFKRTKGVEMIKNIFRNEKALKKIPRQDMTNLLQVLRENIMKAFDHVKQAKHIQSNYLMILLDLLKTLKKVLKTNPDMDQDFGWDTVNGCLESFADRVSLKDFRGLNKSLNNVGSVIGLKLRSSDVCKEKPSMVDAPASGIKASRKMKTQELRAKDIEDTVSPTLAKVSAEDAAVMEDVSAASLNSEKGKKRKKERKSKSNEEQKENMKVLDEDASVLESVESSNSEKGKKRKKEEKKSKANKKLKENTDVEEENVENKMESEQESPKIKKKRKKKHHDERKKKYESRLWTDPTLNQFNFAQEIDVD